MKQKAPQAYLSDFATLVEQIDREENSEEFLTLVMLAREVKRLAADLSREVDRLAARRCEGMKAEIVGRYKVDARRSPNYKWTKNDELKETVISLASWDRETGEERTAREAISIIDEVFRLGGSVARLTALKKYDIDPDEYAESDYRTSVTIVPVAPEEIAQ
ncbi:hypothetical protein UFOVP1305_21 [uncultured Caudovirales phage]|uniref:Uncharacterized protein n=1 Tax=uncultured Caudovirales phage TaxID=2100421 RepID=A0A6J5RVC1_9CAUD|nr:hypothetical protein UFOVP896_59 [uncultured Caudovirales phage]CAB4197568.1 hypothetical protein UFOVP1305_21 [uncultured Caudovirales phage]